MFCMEVLDLSGIFFWCKEYVPLFILEENEYSQLWQHRAREIEMPSQGDELHRQ